MDKVQEMLSDPESMKQIQELANMLTSEMNNGSQQTQNNNNTSQSNSSSEVPPINDNMFNNLFNNGGSSNNNDNGNSNSNKNDNGIDFSMIFQLMQLFNSTSNSQDENLLLAIKPYLNSERQSKVDKAIKFMKIYEVFISAKESGLLNSLDNLI